MHFTVGKSALLKELNLIQGVVEKKSTIPILSNLLLEAKDGELSIKGTDLDVSISTSCPIEAKKSGSLCLQAKKLFEIVRALPEAEIEFKQGDGDQVTIVCERSKFRMAGLPKDNFPEVKTFDGHFTALPAETLRTLIARTQFAITAEESRYTLNGAKFEIAENKVRMVATDGHRLSFVEKSVTLGDAALDVLIPKKTLAELSRLSADTEETVEIGFNDNHLYFRFGKRLLSSRTLSGQFPNYNLVLPKGNDNRVAIPVSQLSAALRRVALMADERSHTVRFDVVPGKLTISAPASESGEANEVLPADYEGPEISSAFNATYLLDFFGVIQEGDALLEFKDSNSQAQLRSKDESDYDFRYIVMPMRL
ncbi:MAG: DNA polymerase III subunit beta [Blastocatellia bacterium]